jgi:two-component system sensor histidine kinase YesM
MDYGTIIRNLSAMKYSLAVYICDADRIVLSNGAYSNQGQDFQRLTDQSRIGFSQEMNLYGASLRICVVKPDTRLLHTVVNHLPGILFLIMINILLPLVLMKELNRSFIVRITRLSATMEKVDGDDLKELPQTSGQDEISNLIRSYNRMAQRINSLIQQVYKNRIHEQDILVAKQNAELLALHSQINPHFLFNALESIRMHSLLKRETETATMVEKLAVMQRQYVDLSRDMVEISEEMDFVSAYLELQKYRFGDRLSYDLHVEPECLSLWIPKLTIVTFVENACVHGIESKTAPGWIFVRIGRKDGKLCIETEDTGKGMSQTEMEELQSRMQNASIDMIRLKGRIGIVNACLRLKMISENQASFSVEGEEGVGMTVTVRIPLSSIMHPQVQERNGNGNAQSDAGR